MKKNLKILIFCLLFCSCKSEKVQKFDEKLIHKIAIEDFNFPSQYNMYYLYVQCENKQISEISVHELRFLFNSNNIDQKNFESFLKKVLNQQQSFDNSKSIDCFSLDEEVMRDYQKAKFTSFIEKYFKKSNKFYKLKKEFNGKRKSIFYYCFLNNYVGVFDDYIGFYYIIKTSELTN